jgi:hypothetical protein
MTSSALHRNLGRVRPSTRRIVRHLAVLSSLAVAVVTVVPGARRSASGLSTMSRGSRPVGGGLAWLVPTAAPVSWHRVALPSGGAVLSVPPSFTPVAGDPRSVSAAVQSRTGKVRAYLNVTPQEGEEHLKGFAAFRVQRLGDEDTAVHERAAAEGLPFTGGRGSCVIDSYVTRVGGSHYREIACFVVGSRGGSVVVAAAASGDWKRFQPILERAVAAFAVA